MSKLSEEQVIKLAELSRLQLTSDEVVKYQAELNAILTYVEQLESVDVTGLRPAYQVSGLHSVMRKDELIAYQAKPADMLARAPRSKDGYIQVGRMI
jgi:aspartyl-tRNA(Asn)/glutamyl-tRNA(Gln) amidotransferase subunit C